MGGFSRRVRFSPGAYLQYAGSLFFSHCLVNKWCVFVAFVLIFFQVLRARHRARQYTVLMVNIIGWTPDSHKTDPGTSCLNQFISPFGRIVTGENDYPLVRSGHRCFTDNDYLYVIGGYTHKIRAGSVFKELWAMSLATFEWRRYDIVGEFPDTLASSALVQIFPFSKMFVLFGGSGTSFGTTSSNKFYFVRVDNENCSIVSHLLNVEGTLPSPKYGHAMCAGEEPGKYYIIGGTSGTRFNFEVHSLTMRTNPQAVTENEKFTWHCELITETSGFAGRYRLEATYDAQRHCLLFFGGGNNQEVFGFEKINTLNLHTRETVEVATTPDSSHGFPEARRCHSLVRRGKFLIITGGIYHEPDVPRHHLHSDVWIFNIEDYSWRKYEHSLPKAVFFHDTVITEDGCMLLFGGVHGITTGSPRNNKLYCMWFGVPRLQRFALETLRKCFPSKFAGLYCGNLRPSGVFEVFNVFDKPETIAEKERELVGKGRIPFHEKEDRRRYYLNEAAEIFAITHQRDEQPVIRLPRRAENQQPINLNIPNGGLVNQEIRLFLERLLGVRREAENVVHEDEAEDEEEDEEVEEEMEVDDQDEIME